MIVFMFIARSIDKFISNHAMIVIDEIKQWKQIAEKNAKTHYTNNVTFDDVRSESPQIVSSSFIMNFNSELTLIHVKKKQ